LTKTESTSALAIECLVAVTGLYPSEPIDSGYVEEAKKIPRQVAESVRAFFDQTRPTQPKSSEKISYLGTWRKLNQKHDDKTAVALISDHEVATAYMVKLTDIRRYLKGQWRPTKINTILEEKLLPPSISEEARCRDLYAMGNDVRRVVGRLTACCILSEEMALVRNLFPEFFSMVGLYLDEEMYRRKVRRKSYEVPYMQSVAIRLFVGDPIEATVETINADSQAPEMSAPPEFDIETRDRRNSMTRADRVEEGNASG
jgi:hypothetical protein